MSGGFREAFEPVLGHTPRWEGFCHIVQDQLRRWKPVIVETGTLREPGNWAGDGCSTLVWQWLARTVGARVFSVDIEQPKVICSSVTHVTEDSVSFLRHYWGPEPTLLYLDSYDYTAGKELDAAMHQVAELAAIWEKLPSGCLIASDDNAGPGCGKAALLRGIFQMLGIKPEIDSHIVVWRKL